MTSDAGPAGPNQELAERWIAVLRQTATETAPWHMDHRARWRMVIGTLLGNAPVRGVQRPRDYPLDEHSRLAVRTAVELQSLAGHRWGWKVHKLQEPISASREARESPPYLLGDFVVAFACLVEQASRPQHDDDLLAGATVVCLRSVRAALGHSDRTWFGACPFLHRLLGLLGINLQEVERLDLKPGTRDTPLGMLEELARAAAVVAHSELVGRPLNESDQRKAASGDAELQGIAARTRLTEATLRALQAKKVTLINLRTSRVLDYIQAGGRQDAQRGASAWCSQALSLARDLLLEAAPNKRLLVSDNEAVVTIVSTRPDHGHKVAAELRKSIGRAWGGPGKPAPPSVRRRFPRLLPYWRLTVEAGVDPSNVVPGMTVGTTRVCLLDLARRGKVLESEALETLKAARRRAGLDSEIPASPRTGTMGLTAVIGGDATQRPFVLGDRILFHEAPPWWRNDPAELGWIGIVWSLCGATYRLQAFGGLSAMCRLNEVSQLGVHHGEWLRALGLHHDPLVYLKLDGDGIGKTLVQHPGLQRPRLGLALSYAVQERLTWGVQAAMRAYGSVPPQLPVDLVYLGGDDVFVILPASLAQGFLDGFAGPEQTAAEATAGAHWRDVSFTYASIVLPAKPNQDRKVLLNEVASALLRPALDAAKNWTRGGPEPTAVDLETAAMDKLSGLRLADSVDLREHGSVRGATFHLQG